MKKPSDWKEYEQLSRDEVQLRQLVRIRLIELIFSQDNATAIRAVELLRETSSETVEDDFSDIPSDILERIRGRADQYIRDAVVGEDGRAENDN